MSSLIKKALVLGLVSSMIALAGCELIVDFDRTKIVGEEVPETGTPETSTPTDSGTDTSTTTDGGTDASDASDAADAADDVQDASDSG